MASRFEVSFFMRITPLVVRLSFVCSVVSTAGAISTRREQCRECCGSRHPFRSPSFQKSSGISSGYTNLYSFYHWQVTAVQY